MILLIKMGKGTKRHNYKSVLRSNPSKWQMSQLAQKKVQLNQASNRNLQNKAAYKTHHWMSCKMLSLIKMIMILQRHWYQSKRIIGILISLILPFSNLTQMMMSSWQVKGVRVFLKNRVWKRVWIVGIILKFTTSSPLPLHSCKKLPTKNSTSSNQSTLHSKNSK